MGEEPPRKKARLNFTDDIEVFVGPEKVRFAVYKDDICARSEFFKAACSERWTKPEGDKSIELPDGEPEIFNAYLHYVYKYAVDVGDEAEPLPGEEESSEGSWKETRMAKLYILADKLRDVCAANTIMMELSDWYEDSLYHLGTPIAEIVANNTSAGSPLRKFVVDTISRDAPVDTIRDICESDAVPKAFVCEILLQKAALESEDIDELLRQGFHSDNGFMPTPCRYRQHDDLHPSCGHQCR